MLLSFTPIVQNPLFKKLGFIGNILNRARCKTSLISQQMDSNYFLEILIEAEKSITQTRETIEAQIIMESVLRRGIRIRFGDLNDRAKRIIRANFCLDQELIEMAQQIISDLPKDFFLP